VITLLAPLFCRAQDAAPEQRLTPVSLQECLAVGLENNYDLRIVRRQEQIAGNNATRGNAGFLPTADLSAGFSGSLNDTRQTPREGGPVVRNSGMNNNSMNAGVDVNWTIFDGFSVQTTYKRLQELQAMGELDTRMAVENYIAELSAAYYNYTYQLIRYRNMNRSIELSRERVRIAELSYTLGVFSRQEYQQAKLDLNSDESRLIAQRETLHAIRTRLNELMGVEDVEARVRPADSDISFTSQLDRDSIEESMLAGNVFLLAAQNRKDISDLDLKLARSRSYPYLRANGGYGYTQNWYGSGASVRQRTTGLNYGVSLGINIFDGLNQRRQMRNAQTETEISELAYKQTEQQLLKDLSDTWMAYSNNTTLSAIEQKNAELANDNYRLTMEVYKEGQLSGYELRAAQVTLLDAEERLVTAQYNTKLCEITLLQISGRVLDYLQ
jgi:outer membrane protein TolC